VAEGVPDWLSWCVEDSDEAEDAPAVLGVAAGNWTPTIAARIPDRTKIVIATDDDGAGHGYAATVAKSIRNREIEVRRWEA